MTICRNCGLILFFLLPILAISQIEESDTRKRYVYEIIKSTSTIKVDGIESDNEWSNYEMIDQMYNHSPTDEGLAKNKTEIRLTYDDKNLYIYAKVYDDGKQRIIRSLQRDNDRSVWQSESFIIAIDPINKKQSGVVLGVNPAGGEFDGSLVVQPSATDYSRTWDFKWFSKTSQHDNYWLVEYAIPFSSLSYSKDNVEWGINFIRRDMTENFFYTWTQYPRNFSNVDINYMGTLKWKEVPNVKSKALFVKPYTTFESTKNNLAEDASTKSEFNVGGDVKIKVTKSINADVTINPDFSNADVDQEVTNITRFSIFLPERREFFTENADIFTNFGNNVVRPFFSRRIGLANGQSIPIVYGLRSTGNLTNNLRFGVMNVQTKREGDVGAQNNTVAALNYRVFNRSQLKGLFINQEGDNSTYNRNFGTEFTYISKKGNFNNSLKFHKSFSSNADSGYYYGFSGNYYTRALGTGWNFDVVNKDYSVNLGFAPRLFNFDAENQTTVKRTFTLINPWIRYRFYTKNPDSKLIYHGFRTWHMWYVDGNDDQTERENNVAYDLRFKSTSSLTAMFTNRQVHLQFPTNFLGSQFDNLPVDKYLFSSGSIRYSSDYRKILSYNTGITFGEFYNGNIVTLNAGANLRFSYWGNFNLSYSYNDISLPQNFGNVDLNLVKLISLISFTNKLSLNNTVQYNSQSTNFSVFSRLQWRYSPLSDVFLIYNQNNDTDGFGLRNRSLILKFTYRFGV